MEPRLTLLVVAAHPDDETIGAARLLLRARRAAVVHLTDGAPRDPALRRGGPSDRKAYAAARRAEARAALAVAGIRPGNVLGLGASDQEAHLEIPRLARELAEVIALCAPRLVVTHPLEGGHPDHDAAAIVARAGAALAVAAGAPPPTLVEMTSYHLHAGALRTGVFLPGGPEGVVRRLLPEEREAKRFMLDRYETQRATLAAFDLEAERYRVAPAVRLDVRPHPAPLHYELRGWATWETFRRSALDALRALGLAEHDADAAAGAPA